MSQIAGIGDLRAATGGFGQSGLVWAVLGAVLAVVDERSRKHGVDGARLGRYEGRFWPLVGARSGSSTASLGYARCVERGGEKVT